MRQLTLLIGALGIQACAPAPPREPAPAATALPKPSAAARRQIFVAPECDGPARSVPQPMPDSLRASFARLRSNHPSGEPVQDNYWHAALARNLPGRFAGLYFGSPAPPYIGRSIQGDRRVVVMLADTTSLERALAALEPHDASRRWIFRATSSNWRSAGASCRRQGSRPITVAGAHRHPRRLLESGFVFQYPEWAPAAAELVGRAR